MLVINYNGNKPTTDYFKFAVQGNNNADVVRFCLDEQQGNIDLTTCKVYVLAKCDEDDFIDKVEITDNVSSVGSQLNAEWVLLKKHTINRQLLVGLCFEDENEEIVWQTQLVKIAIANGIDADEEIANKYPSIIQDLIRGKVYDLPADYEIKPISEVYAKVGEVAFMIQGTIFRIYKHENTYELNLFNKYGSGTHNLTADTSIESIFDGDPYQKIYVDENSLGGLVEEILGEKALDIQLSDFRIEVLDQHHIELTYPKGIMVREIIFSVHNRDYHLSFNADFVSNLKDNEIVEIESEWIADLTYQENNSIELYFEQQIPNADVVAITFVAYDKIAGMTEI